MSSEYTLVTLPPKNPLLGHMIPVSQDMPAFFQTLIPYGDMVRFRVANAMFVALNNADLVGEFMVKKAKSFHKARSLKLAAGNMENIFNSDGDYWRKQHQLMMPAFHSKRINAYADQMTAHAEQTAQGWQDGQTVDMLEAMQETTLRVILETMFGMSMDERAERLKVTLADLLELMGKRAKRNGLPPTWLPLPENFRLARTLNDIVAPLGSIMQEWRQHGEDRGDLLSTLMLARYENGEPMTDAQIMNELTTIYIAGHDTSANSLAYAWVALSQNPAIEAALHAELDAVLGDRVPTLADLPKLHYTEMLLKETLRMYNAANAVVRDAIEDVEIGGHIIHKGEAVAASMWALHYHPNYFANPHTFDPQRFSEANAGSIHKYAYFPFGGGPRVCIGNQFAMMEMKLILATLARCYRFQLVTPGDVPYESSFTVGPKGPVPMIVHKRN